MRKSLLLIISICLIIGCTGKDSPITPEGQIAPDVNYSIPVGVFDRNSDGIPIAGTGTLGLFNLHLDPENISAELTSLRKNNLTDVLETVDITNFLTLAPCFDCVKIRSVSLDADSNLVLSIGIKHPFGVGNPLKPITGRNRADLHVFNVEGIVVSNSVGKSFPDLEEAVADFTLINADGLTGYLDVVLDPIYPSGATIHSFITHVDDYATGNFDAGNPMGFASVTDPPPSGNLVMAMGCDYDFQDYVFSIDTSIDVIFAVGCTYAVSSASKSERFNPEYRVPQHNKKAASEVSIEIISNDLASGDTSSSAVIEIHVVDISHGVAVGSALNEMLADSSVDEIRVELPGVLSLPLVIEGSTSISGTGHDPSDPLVYQATITNHEGGTDGIYTGLVKVLDSYPTGLNSFMLLNSMDGIKRVDPTENPLVGIFAIDEFATYQTFEIEILTPNQPPVANAVLTTSVYVSGQAAITFDASASSDPDGTIESYEWDFNDDGIFDGTGDEYTGSSWNPTHNFVLGVCVDIQLRVTDNRSAIDDLDTPLTVCPFKNVVLRPSVSISDIATIEDTNEVLVLYEDHQVWKYNNDLSTGALFYTMPGYPTTGQRIEASSNGDSCCGWWNSSQWHWYSYFASGALAAEHSYPWPGYPATPPYNFDLAVSYCPNSWVIPGTHHLLGNFFQVSSLPTWVRAGYVPTAYTNWTSNYNNQHTGPGAGRIEISYLKGMHARKSTDQSRTIYCLEGAPEWRVEIMSILAWVTVGWGGTQTDANSGFNNPQDISFDGLDNAFVIDILSTGERKIKKFTYTGTPLGSFGNNITMASDPERHDASFASNWIYVTMDDRVSIFFPNEQP